MTFDYAVNCSMIFTEVPLAQRPAAARQAGFKALEFWWPFSVAVPPAEEVDEFVDAVDNSQTRLIGLNFFAGDMPAGDRGLVSSPEHSGEFADNIPLVVDIAERTGCRAFNALVGNRVDGASAQEQDDLAVENLARAAKAVAEIGGIVLVEPVSGAPRYAVKTADEAVALIERVEKEKGVDNVKLLFDAYHLAANGDDVFAALDKHYDRIGHVQIADDPGRHEPGTGELDIARLVSELDERGYDGYVALEYKPSTASADSFEWLPRDERGERASGEGRFSRRMVRGG